jgi:protein ImuB
MVLIDVAGSERLFGGEPALLDDLSARLAAAGLTARLGVADTAGAAIALARRFDGREAADAVLMRLDQALGRRGEPFAPLEPPPRHVVRLACPEPLLAPEGVAAGLDRLLAGMERRLVAAGKGARRFRFTLYRVDGSLQTFDVAASRPSRDRAHLRRLFAERLATADPGHGVDALALEAHRCGPMEPAPRALSPELRQPAQEFASLAELVDRIMARLGETAPRRLGIADSRQPAEADLERSFAAAPPPLADAPPGGRGARPLRLLDPPEPVEVMAEVPDGPPRRFVWRRAPRRVARASGPERIAPDWWRGGPGRTRDYYQVEDGEGRRYWLYRDGLYDETGEPGGQPRWFIHGLFA